MSQSPRSRRRGSFTGEKIGGNRVIAVQGLLNSGVSKSKIAKDLKISRNSVMAIEQRMNSEGVLDPQRVQLIRETFQERHVLLCDDAMRQIDTHKLKQSSAWDLVKISEKAVQVAGIAEKPSGIHPQTLASETDGRTADGTGQFEVDP